jgi:uncharacterized coiled-coil DUF342 family protein
LKQAEISAAQRFEGETMSKNSDYAAQMQTQLDKWDADVDALVAEGAKRNAQARTAYEGQVKHLRASRDAAHETFQKLRAASESASAQLRDGMQDAWDSMQKMLTEVSSDLRK